LRRESGHDPFGGLPCLFLLLLLRRHKPRDWPPILGDHEALAAFSAADQLGKFRLGLIGANSHGAIAGPSLAFEHRVLN
jgi:hypothetical protein